MFTMEKNKQSLKIKPCNESTIWTKTDVHWVRWVPCKTNITYQ